MITKYMAAVAALALSTSVAQAATQTLDFEEFNAGDVVSTVSVGGVTGTLKVRTNSHSNIDTSTKTAIVLDSRNAFDPQNPADGDPDLQAPFYAEFDANGDPVEGTATSNPGNVLIIGERPDADAAPDNFADDNASGGIIQFTFKSAVNFAGFDVFDDVTDMIVKGWVRSTDPNGKKFVMVAMEDQISLSHDNQFANVDLADNDMWWGIERLTFDFRGNSGAIDNLQFNVAAVPVPATLPLLLAGLGGMAYVGRRRRKA